MRSDIVCPPYDFDSVSQLPADATILQRAAHASSMAHRYRAAMEARLDLRTTFRIARELADATDALTTAIVDAVACGDNRLS